MHLLQCATAKLQCRSPSKVQLVREECAARRVQEAAAKAQKAKELKEKQDRVKQLVIDAVVALGETESFAAAVASRLEKRGRFLKILDESECIIQADLHASMDAVKVEWFEQKLLVDVPWSLTDLQKSAVVKEIMRKLAASDLSNCRQNVTSSIWQDALASAMQTSELFTCPICMDPLVEFVEHTRQPQMSNMWFARLQKNEHWSSQPCGHACCRTCMKMWAETAINDQKVNVRCPAPGCSYSLFDHDIKSLVSSDAFERLQEHKNADYLQHLRKALKEDMRLNSWLNSNARPCPDCHVIVSRYEGCDAMQCVCGTRFCYACGFKSCKCGKAKRTDIWKPKVARKQEASAKA